MNFEEEQYPSYSSYEDAELKRLFESAETDSETYDAIMDELVRRGYDFEPDAAQEASGDLAPAFRPLRYGFWSSRLWNIIAIVLSVMGAAFFIRSNAVFGEIEPVLYIMVYAFVALIISMSYLVSGIRLLANHKSPGHPLLRVPTIEYWLLCILWYAAGAHEVYTTVSSFTQYMKDFQQYDFGLSLSITGVIPSLGMAVFSILLGTAFLYLARELRVK